MSTQKICKQKSSGGIQLDLCSSDFYKCVNKEWLDSVHVPPYKAAFGVSEEIEQCIEGQLFDIAYHCQSLYRKSPSKKSIEHCVGAVVDSVLKTSAQPKNIQSILYHLGTLHAIQTPEDIGKVMGEFCRFRIGTLMRIDGFYNEKQDGHYCLEIRRGVIGLPDKMYYEDSKIGRKKTVLYYKEYLQKVSKELGIPSLDPVVDVEKRLAPYILMKRISEKDGQKTGSELVHAYPHIPWDSFFTGFGFSHWKQHTFKIESHEWLKIIDTLFHKESVEFWRLLFSSEIIHHCIAYMPPPFDDYHYEFFRKRLRGQAQKLPQKYLLLEVLTEWMPHFLSKLYKEKFLTEEFRSRADTFAEEIQAAAIHRLGDVEWLEPNTRKLAQEKVRAMRLSIGFPSTFVVSPLPKVSDDCLIQNLFVLGEWKTDQDLHRLGTTRKSQKGWEDPIYAVNGYYYSEDNELIIPSGSLLSPFYDESKPLGWNYGGLGVIMGHEITHAFDEEGKEYDQDGKKKAWWEAKDKRRYEEKTNEIIELFSKQKVFGHPVDGKSTLSENIADLGGLAIALDALKIVLEKKKASLEERIKAYQQFFISYAVSWRIKEKPEKQIQGLLVDRHAPTPLRVNLVVNQFQEWYDAFDIKPSDPMFVDPKKRLKIF